MGIVCQGNWYQRAQLFWIQKRQTKINRHINALQQNKLVFTPSEQNRSFLRQSFY